MSKKQNTAQNKQNSNASTNNLILGLVVLLCLVTLFVVIKQQGEIEHLGLTQTIDTMKSIGNR
jgi:cell division protein FtsN